MRDDRRIAVTFPNESRPRHERTTTRTHKRSAVLIVFVGNVASTAMASYSISDSVKCLEGVDYNVVKVSTTFVLCLFRNKPKTFRTRPRRARKRTNGRHVSIGRLPNEHTNFKNIPTICVRLGRYDDRGFGMVPFRCRSVQPSVLVTCRVN